MTPETLAAIHARTMSVPPPWSAQAFKSFIDAPGALLSAFSDGGEGLGGFALGRWVLDEAELLTLAVDPASQGRGIGKTCLERFLGDCRRAGATRVFLEVAASNAIARSLYISAGFKEDGVREGYYHNPQGGTVDAILMSRAINS